MKENIRKQFSVETVVLLFGLALLFLLSGCSEPLTGPMSGRSSGFSSGSNTGRDPNKGTIVLNFGSTASPASTHRSSIAVSSADSAIAYTNSAGDTAMNSVLYDVSSTSMSGIVYRINISDTNSGALVYGPEEVTGGGIVSIEITPGSYTINITAFLNGIQYAKGSSDSTVVVTAGANSSANIKMNVDIVEYLKGCAASNNSEIYLPVSGVLDSAKWTQIFAAIQKMNDACFGDPPRVHLNLSQCTVPDGIIAPGNPDSEARENIQSIILPDSATKIGDNAFSGCGNLESISMPRVTSIGNGAFSETSLGNNNGGSVTIPSGVTTIGNNAFQNCFSIENLTIPARVNSIGEYAFAGCAYLTSVKFDGDYTSVDPNAFDGNLQYTGAGTYTRNSSSSPWVKYVFYTVTFNANGGTLTGTSTITQQTPGAPITMPADPTRNGFDFAGWYNNINLTGSSVGASYIPTGNVALYAKWTVTVTYNANGGTGTLPAAQTVAAGGSVTVADGSGLSKAGYTFSGWNTNANGSGTSCSVNSTFNPPAHTTLFAQWTPSLTPSFSGSTNVVSDFGDWLADIPANSAASAYTITLNIGDSDMAGLKQKLLNNTGKYITLNLSGNMLTNAALENAFQNCTNLVELTLPNTITETGKSMCDGCTNLKKVTLPNSLQVIGDYSFNDCALTEVSIPTSVITIGGYAFRGTKLTEVTIPASVITIGTQAFAKQPFGFEKVVFSPGSNITTFEYGAFPDYAHDFGDGLKNKYVGAGTYERSGQNEWYKTS